MNDITFKFYDYPIGGKMVTGTCRVSEMDAMNMEGTIGGKEKLKESLLHQLASYMLENKLAEFTMTENPIDGTRIYRVRAYLAPNDQVKILRIGYKIG